MSQALNRCAAHDWTFPPEGDCPECMLQRGNRHHAPIAGQGVKAISVALSLAGLPEAALPQFVRAAEELSSYWHVIRDIKRYLAAGGY